MTDTAESEILSLLVSVSQRLELLLGRATFEKSHYSVKEAADLTAKHGIKSYSPFSIRLACNEGRIPDASKPYGKGLWTIPQAAMIRILNEGIPPERRESGARKPR